MVNYLEWPITADYQTALWLGYDEGEQVHYAYVTQAGNPVHEPVRLDLGRLEAWLANPVGKFPAALSGTLLLDLDPVTGLIAVSVDGQRVGDERQGEWAHMIRSAKIAASEPPSAVNRFANDDLVG